MGASPAIHLTQPQMPSIPPPEPRFVKAPPGGCLGGPLLPEWNKLKEARNKMELFFESPFVLAREKARYRSHDVAALLLREAMTVNIQGNGPPPHITAPRARTRPSSAPAASARTPSDILLPMPPPRPSSARSSVRGYLAADSSFSPEHARRLHVYQYQSPPKKKVSPGTPWSAGSPRQHTAISPRHHSHHAALSPRAPVHRISPVLAAHPSAAMAPAPATPLPLVAVPPSGAPLHSPRRPHSLSARR